jgi:hypothetical protein
MRRFARRNHACTRSSANHHKEIVLFRLTRALPVAILLLSARPAAAGYIGLAWDPPSNSLVDKYVISYGTAPGVYAASLDVGKATTWFVTGLTDGSTYYLAVKPCNAAGCSSYSSPVSGAAYVAAPSTPANFNSDSRSELAVWRPGTGAWLTRAASPNTPTAAGLNIGLGIAALSDRPVPGDYDGDGKTDLAVWRRSSGTWYVLESSASYTVAFSVQLGSGAAGDVPVPADYDGDGVTDIAVWRPGNGAWSILTSKSHFTAVSSVVLGSGALKDVPVPADYDGDNRADVAVWRPGTGDWLIKTSGSGYTNLMQVTWGGGSAASIPVPADYDGDGRADLAVWRPGAEATWLVKTSRTNYVSSFSAIWGSSMMNDVPVVGDYDGDGKTDLSVWRPATGTWYIVKSSTGYTAYDAVQFGSGSSGDMPLSGRVP